MLPSATDLKYFIEVSKVLNLSRSAERLGITQPTLTQSIRKLEHAVGTDLFIRSKSGMRLTRAGVKMVSKASDLLNLWENLRQEALNEEEEIKGRFKVGCHPSVGRYILPQFFQSIQKTAPAIEIDLVHDLSRKITEGVISFEVDLGFVINPVSHPDLVLKKLGEDTVTLFKYKGSTPPPIIFGDSGLNQTQEILKALRKTKLEHHNFVPCSNLEVIQAIGLAKVGYVILPERIAISGDAPLVRVGDGMPEYKDQIFMAYRREVMKSKAGSLLTQLTGKVLA